MFPAQIKIRQKERRETFHPTKNSPLAGSREGLLPKRRAHIGLLKIRAVQANALFGVYDWPEKFTDAWEVAETRRQKVKVAAKRIEHFIATGE